MPHPLTTKNPLSEIEENFEFLDEWEDRYGYLIELGRQLEPLDEAEMNEDSRVQGCVSQVWVVDEIQHTEGEPRFYFRGASDAHIVRGLVAIALTLFSGKTAREILDEDAEAVFSRLGLAEHLTPQRANGLRSMVQRIKAIASRQTD